MKQAKTKSGAPEKVLSRKTFLMDAFDRYERQLTAYALKFYGGPRGDLHAARDAVQFTFMKLCQQNPDQIAGKLAPWLYTVCRNRIFAELRSSKKQSQLNGVQVSLLDANTTDPAEQLEIDDFLQRLPQLLESLNAGEKEVVELWSHGLKPGEIADVIDQPPGTIRVRLHRGIKKLQQHPEVSPWLERATGQNETAKRSALNSKALKTTLTTGEQK